MLLVKEPEATPLPKEALSAICIVFEVCESISSLCQEVLAEGEVVSQDENTQALDELERDLDGYFESALSAGCPLPRLVWLVQQRLPEPYKTRFLKTKR